MAAFRSIRRWWMPCGRSWLWPRARKQGAPRSSPLAPLVLDCWAQPRRRRTGLPVVAFWGVARRCEGGDIWLPMHGSRARLDDVARRAGVSLSTASRVINDNGYPVAEATRQRVLDAVRELSYSPSVLARALVTKRTQIVGVIVGDVEDPYFAEIVRGVEDVARQAGYLVIVCNADRDPTTELSYLRTLLDYRVDGVILAGGGVLDEAHRQPHIQAVARLEHQGTVVVALAEVAAPVPRVSIDNRGAAAAMTRYVVGLGHTRIGVIAGPEGITTAQSRLQGIRDVLGTPGQPSELVAGGELTLVNGGFTVEGGECAAEVLFTRAPAPTAIVAVNDQMAVGALTAAH